ncbi:MAG TPA: hypothetical protein VHT91_08685 [Kofleriaceae bacterium]|nr:hypothetical protein [Kofleriaceae bacterium]
MRPIRLVILLGVLGLPLRAVGEPCPDPAALRAELEHESARVDRWVLAWRIVYTAAAVGELGIAASGVASHDNTVSAWVGGGKSTLAALGFWVTPLRIKVPPPTGDACYDRAALREAAARAADDERDAFWTAHIGGLIVNAGATILLAETTSWKTGLLSFATGYPVGLLSTYTMPRTSWARVREPAWTASVVVDKQRYGLVVAGAF